MWLTFTTVRDDDFSWDAIDEDTVETIKNETGNEDEEAMNVLVNEQEDSKDGEQSRKPVSTRCSDTGGQPGDERPLKRRKTPHSEEGDAKSAPE